MRILILGILVLISYSAMAGGEHCEVEGHYQNTADQHVVSIAVDEFPLKCSGVADRDYKIAQGSWDRDVKLLVFCYTYPTIGLQVDITERLSGDMSLVIASTYVPDWKGQVKTVGVKSIELSNKTEDRYSFTVTCNSNSR